MKIKVSLNKNRSSATIIWFLGALISVAAAAKQPQFPQIPTKLPFDSIAGKYFLQVGSDKQYLTINPRIQQNLEQYSKRKGNHIAAAVLLEIETGKVLALAQGKAPDKWNSTTHSALYTGFPAASLFKTVGSAAAIELADIKPDSPTGLVGGCQKVRATPRWLTQTPPSRRYKMSLRRAYALSCNGYFAKILMKFIGLNALNHFAGKLGWGKKIAADFNIPLSPMLPPAAAASNVQTAGKYAAGFGSVGLSAVHAAWQMVVIANKGKNKSLRIFENAPQKLDPVEPSLASKLLEKVPGIGEVTSILPKDTDTRILEEKTAEEMLYVMNRTTINGTASFAFKRRPYRNFRNQVGGKTGTLNGDNPKGLTTWFAGLMPLDKPEVAVAAVTVNGDFWVIKGAHLAAHALLEYRNEKRRVNRIAKAQKKSTSATK